jgi:hypothetical protein
MHFCSYSGFTFADNSFNLSIEIKRVGELWW